MIGDPRPAIEAVRYLRGEGRFVDDIALPNTRQVAFVRSKHPHARLEAVHVERAKRAPGVLAVVTLQDLGDAAAPVPLLFAHAGFDQVRTHTALVDRVTRYEGEPIAAVIASSRYAAEDAAELVDVDYAPLRAVMGAPEALAPGAPLVHHDLTSNAVGEATVSVGDVDGSLRTAPHVITTDFDVERGASVSLEGRAVLARWDDATGLTLWSSTQRPVKLRNALAGHLGLSQSRIRVIAPDIGGGFGPKGMYLYPEEIVVAWAACQFGCALKWVEDRSEHFLATTQSRGQHHRMTVGFDDEGRLLALATSFVSDGGAYVPYGLSVPAYTALTIPGPYVLPAYRATWRVAYTNRVPTSPYRGSGGPYATFVMERALDLVSGALELDRAEIRRRNLISVDRMPYTSGLPYADGGPAIHDSGDYHRTLETALARASWRDFSERQVVAGAQGRRLGIGIACYAEGTGLKSVEGARVTVDPSGTILVRTGSSSQGQGHQTTIAQVVASVLRISPEQVSVIQGDTDAFGWGLGTYGSKMAVVAGTAAHRAAQQVHDRAIAAASDVLELAPSALQLAAGRVEAIGDPSRGVALGELASRLLNRLGTLGADDPPPGLDATVYFAPERASLAMGVHVAEVEVRPSGEVIVGRYVVCSDAGRPINPGIVDGQLRGGVIQGIGGVLHERLIHDGEESLLTTGFSSYPVPRTVTSPRVELVHVDTRSSTSELGVKGVGEAGVFPVAAVIASAVENALGLEPGSAVKSTPLMPEALATLAASSPSRHELA